MTNMDPARPARRRSPLVTHSLLGVVATMAFTAVTGFPDPPPDPSVHETTVDLRDGALAGGVTLPVEVDGGPELIGLTWDTATPATFEVRALDGDGWSAWLEIDGPDSTPDGDTGEWHGHGYAGPAFLGRDITDIELRQTAGAVTPGLVVHAIDSEPVDGGGDGVAEAAVAPAPAGIITRAQWGANEGWRDDSGGECDGTPDYSDGIDLATVHHTVSGNDYTPQESAAIIRAIYDFHVHGNGWCDVGYNFFVDRFGQIFEGRYGGIYRTAIGGHTSGFNTMSTGVAVIGDFSSAAVPPAAYDALVRLLSFKLAYHGVDPLGQSTVTVKDNSSARWPEGTVVTLNNIQGHRDSNKTSCPGQSLYNLLPQLRNDVASRITAEGYQAAYTIGRIAAADRFATAGAIAKATFPAASAVYLARGDGATGFADALAANYVAGLTSSPVLLTTTGEVPQATLEAITTLGAHTVTVLGGEAAVAPAVVDGLTDGGMDVTRIAGRDRYATAANIAQGPGPGAVGTVGGLKTAVLSSGTNFADALAAGGLVYARHLPQLLTQPTTLPQATATALQNLGIQHVIITGGTNAVSLAVEAAVALNGVTVERIAGPTRYATAVALADAAIDRFGFAAGHLDFATGESFPDALVGGPHAGGLGAPLLLVPKGDQIGPVCDFLRRRADTSTVGTILGGRSAFESGAKYAIEECTAGFA